jgi:hypothetical protein
MPSLKKDGVMLEHKTCDATDFVRSEAPIRRQGQGIEPKFGNKPLTFHMNVCWFSTVRTEENETIGANLEHRGHEGLPFVYI